MFGIQKFDFLIALYITCIAISELMGGKTFPLFTIGSLHLSTSVAIFVVPLVYCINDTVTEVFGKPRAQSIVRSGLFMIFLILLFSLLATRLPATLFFTKNESAYETIFSVSARISAASLIAFALGEFADVYIFAGIRQKLGKKSLWLRTNAANFISQFIDTALFLTLAFYALNQPFAQNIAFLVGLIIPYWLIKCAMSLIETPLVYLAVNWLKEKK